MSLQTLTRRVDRLSLAIAPRPRIINCTGAREELLAKIEASMTDEERATPEQRTPAEQAEFEAACEAISAMLDENIARIERECNVRFVSYDDD